MPRSRFLFTTGSVVRSGAIVGLSVALLAMTSTTGASAAPPTSTAPTKASPSQLASLGLAVSDDGWINYTKSQAPSLGLADLKTTTVQGTRESDGTCVISGSSTSSSTAPTYEEEVGFNPTTCTSKITTGTITPTAAAKLAAADPAPDTTGSATGTAAASTGGTASAQVTAKATSYQSAHTVTKWIDPVNITITRQAINLKWPLYGAGGTLTSSWPAYKFAYDGWSVSGPTFSGFKTLSGDAGWYVSAKSHFTNYDFAALIYFLLGLPGWLACGAHFSTRADFYHNVTVRGYRSGSRGSSWSDSKSGACSNLVHHATSNGYGWY